MYMANSSREIQNALKIASEQGWSDRACADCANERDEERAARINAEERIATLEGALREALDLCDVTYPESIDQLTDYDRTAQLVRLRLVLG